LAKRRIKKALIFGKLLISKVQNQLEIEAKPTIAK
jgi:hypothetical protein